MQVEISSSSAIMFLHYWILSFGPCASVSLILTVIYLSFKRCCGKFFCLMSHYITCSIHRINLSYSVFIIIIHGGRVTCIFIMFLSAIGRSNVGKSSLLNSLTRQWGVARTSDKPGLTQVLHSFPEILLLNMSKIATEQ